MVENEDHIATTRIPFRPRPPPVEGQTEYFQRADAARVWGQQPQPSLTFGASSCDLLECVYQS